MPSFDIVSRTNIAEIDNALNNMSREMGQRYDFKNSRCSVQRAGDTITILADDEPKLRQMHELLTTHLVRRGVEVNALKLNKPEKASGDTLRQAATIRQGIDAELARKIIKAVKDSKLKVQASVQGDELRVTGKKRDDLQRVIALVKEMEVEQPLQYVNLRE